jgi:hypothetical protein
VVWCQTVKALEVVSERTAHLIELLRRNTDEIEHKSEEMRSSLLLKVKSKVNPTADRFRAEVAALNKYKASLKQEGLLEAFVVLASEKGLKVCPFDVTRD